MAESTVSIIIDVIRQKLDNAALRVKDKYRLLELQEHISRISNLVVYAEMKLFESHQIETWLKKLQDALKANDLMNKDIELTGLDATISKIKNVLYDAEKKQGDNKPVKIWLKKLEDVVYEADDLMDEVYNEANKHNVKEALKVEPVDLKPNQLKKLKNIEVKLKAAAEDHGKHIGDDDANSSKEGEEEPHKVFTKEFDPNFEILPSDYWMLKHVKDVKRLLSKDKNKDQKKVAAVAIVGYGGLGKTTLAQQVFLDWEIEWDFDLRIWLNVPHDFNTRSLVEGIIMYKHKMKHNRQLIESAREREVERIFMSLVEGVIKSTAKKDGSEIKMEIEGEGEGKSEGEGEGEGESEIEIEGEGESEDGSEGEGEGESEDGSESKGEVSVKMKVIEKFFCHYDDDDDQWNGFGVDMKSAIDKHFDHLDEGQFRKEMSAIRQKEYLRLLNEDTDQLVVHKKDAEGIRNKLETEMSKRKEELQHLDDHKLHEVLRKKIIKGKRLLLVLDDVSNMDPKMWEDFKNLLSTSKVGDSSRIIITTRNKDITSMKEDFYQLSNLDEDVSWSFFERVAFGRVSAAVDSKIKKTAREMVKKCGGNPFALRTLGEKFNSKNLETFNSINPETLPEFQKVLTEKILPSLKPSYDILPPHLKHCFAYCSIFPQQHEIDVKNLIRLWMAQGLIYPPPGQRMEDVGYEYFQNLRQRSLFEEVEVDPENHSVTKCKMPNLIQDLAVFVAGTRLATLNEKDKHSIKGSAQHVSFHFHLHSSWKIPTSFLQAKRIQTIILPCQWQQETQGRLSHSTCENIISNCKALRTLDLHNTGIDKLPTTIGKLKYLRYLDLSQNKAIKSLPDSITEILYLMTLKLSKCYGLEELPRNMKKLVHLKHLEIDWCYNLTHMPLGLGELTQLETLSQFALKYDAADSAKLDELEKLKNLRGELKVQNLTGDMNSGVAKLEGKQHLKSLTLAWKIDESANTAPTDLITIEGLKPHSDLKELALFGYRSNEFPEWLISHTKLVKFSLQKCKCESLPPLNQLSSLKVLILDQMANLMYISDKPECHSSSSTAFMPSLEELRLTELPKLKGWWENVSKTPTPLPSFPRLSRLLIEDCPKLCSMPLYPNLKEWLVLDNTSLETFIQTMDSESSFTQTMNDQSSSKATMNDKKPSRPLSKSKSLPIVGNLKISSEDGENDKFKLVTLKRMDSESFSKQTMNEESSSKATMNNEAPSRPLSNLRSLRIIGNKEISSKDGDHHKIEWERLTSLRILRFDYLPTLKMLPEGLQYVTTLEELQIWRCDIDTLPKWIKNLKSLKTLRLLTCPFLESLPSDGLGSSLKTLQIIDCPILLQRCQKNTGADWNLIKDIKHLQLQQPQSSIIFKSSKESTEEKTKS